MIPETCRLVREELAEAVDREQLGPALSLFEQWRPAQWPWGARRRRIDTHLAQCPGCTAERDELTALYAALGELARFSVTAAAPAPDLAAAVLRALPAQPAPAPPTPDEHPVLAATLAAGLALAAAGGISIGIPEALARGVRLLVVEPAAFPNLAGRLWTAVDIGSSLASAAAATGSALFEALHAAVLAIPTGAWTALLAAGFAATAALSQVLTARNEGDAAPISLSNFGEQHS